MGAGRLFPPGTRRLSHPGERRNTARLPNPDNSGVATNLVAPSVRARRGRHGRPEPSSWRPDDPAQQRKRAWASIRECHSSVSLMLAEFVFITG